MKPYLNGNYPQVTFTHHGVRKSYSLHALVLGAFRTPKPAGSVARHLDGNKFNNRLDNLAWGTPSENMQDRIAHGTNPQLSKTECPKGHPYDETNTYVRKNGHRQCRTCARTFNPERHQHGKLSSYVKGCRCPECRAASAAYARKRRARNARARR